MDSLLQLDEWLFGILNGSWRSEFLDVIAPHWRNKYFWAPFYIFILTIVAVNFKRVFLPFLLFALFTVALADTLSSKIIKPLVKRERPCQQENLSKPPTVLINCGAGYSFTSSHATNHFAIACFFLITLGAIFPVTKSLFLLWAASISYGQIYVGVHFPLDVIVGALLGSMIGILAAYVFHRHWSFTVDNLEPIA